MRYDYSTITPPATVFDSPRAQLETLRDQLNTVADPISRENTMADVLTVLAMSHAELVAALAVAHDLDSVRAAAERQAALTKPLIDGVANGTLRLPYAAKHVSAAEVVAEFATLSNGISAVFEKEGQSAKAHTTAHDKPMNESDSNASGQSGV